MIAAINTSKFHLSMIRRRNIWYSVKDGLWTDPGTWQSNSDNRRGIFYPKSTDDVYIHNNVIIDGSMIFNINNVYIIGSLIFTNTSSQLIVAGDFQCNGTLDMTAGASQLRLRGVNNYIVNFPTPSNNSTITYERSGDQDVMNLTYGKLVFDGYGNKNIYNPLTVNSTTTFNGNSTIPLVIVNKSIFNKLTFIGNITTGTSNSCTFDNTVNADIEMRGGAIWDVRFVHLLLGTGNLILNGTQTLSVGGAGSGYVNTNTILVKADFTVTLAVGNTPFIVNGSLNGENSLSTFNVSGVLYQGTSTEPMSTGIYNYNFGGTSGIGYTFNGNFTLPHTAYNSLYILGTGTKTLGGNTILTGPLTIDSGGTLELAANNLSVGGITHINASATLTKNSAIGSTVFIGLVDMSLSTSSNFKFNAASTVEFRGGMTWDVRNVTIVSVTGSTWNFTTSNQTIDVGGGTSLLMGCNILISGAITVTLQNQGFGITGTLNGDNVSSKFLSTKFFSYANTQQPMQTGILDVTTNTTTCIFIYSLTGAQDITPGTYANLTLKGSGAKKLLGNLSVINTYSLISPAILDLNGFTLTNP